MEFLTQYKYVVVDFETTGNRAKDGDQIIQVGMCVIEGGEITERFSSYVRPTVKIPSFIEQLTGITEADVQDAPPIEELLPEMIKRLDQGCFVAHNVHFDLSFYQTILEENGYYPFTGAIIDTVELSRILLPDQEGYKLKQLSSDFDVEHEHPHQADSDALATALLFIQLCEKIEELPLITVQRMIPIAKTLHSDLDTLLRRAESSKLLSPAKAVHIEQNVDVYRHFAFRKELPTQEPTRKQERLLQPHSGEEDWLPLTADDLQSVNIEKYLKNVLLSYEPREGQRAFYQHIVQTFQAGRYGISEVGTGTGKTLAYLFAAALWAYTSQEKVVISTYTIPLQEQIITKEWPVVQAALPIDINASVIKGKHHYVCLKRLEQAFTTQHGERNYDNDLTRLQLLVWLTRTSTGDVEEVNLSAGGKEFWKRVQTEDSSCFERDCPWFKRCFYYKAKIKANASDIVVTNHTLLISDQKLGHVLPGYRYAIIDEAHHLEQVAIEHLGITVSYSHLYSLFQRLVGVERQSMHVQLSQLFQLLVEGKELEHMLAELDQHLHELKEWVDQAFTALYLFAKEKDIGFQEGSRRMIRIQHPSETGKRWEHVLQITELMDACATATFRKLHILNGKLYEVKKDSSTSQKLLIQEFRRMGEELERGLHDLSNHLLEADLQKNVYWFEFDQQGNRQLMSYQIRSLNASDYLKDHFLKHKESVILTSATLQVKQSFAYMLERLGLQEENTSILRVPSPFNYREQAKVYISEDISILSDVSEVQFARELADSIKQVALITGGRMLVLFTSYRLLKLTHEQLKEPLHEQGIFLYAQGIDSGSRMKLTKNFQSQDKAVLLGTSSFWEGIDIPGEDLSCLVIVKLPFTPPNTPYYEAKAEELKRENKNSFMDYALPQAVIRFKQGFGRLIRSAADRGVIIIFDRRIIAARYGKVFLDSLPDVPIDVAKKDELLQDLKEWFARSEVV